MKVGSGTGGEVSQENGDFSVAADKDAANKKGLDEDKERVGKETGGPPAEKKCPASPLSPILF